MTPKIEVATELIDGLLMGMTDFSKQKETVVHTYEVAHLCRIIALKRNEDQKLAVIAGLLRDSYRYLSSSSVNHA